MWNCKRLWFLRKGKLSGSPIAKPNQYPHLPSASQEESWEVLMTKESSCDLWPKSFATSGALWSHKQTHVGKMFNCPECKKLFSQKSTLKKHFLIHAGGKPFSCKCCSYSRNRVDTLKSHVFQHTGEKSHQCNQCDFTPTHSVTLIQHELTHTEEKPFKRNQCSYSANRFRTLTIALNELPFLSFCRCYCICPGIRWKLWKLIQIIKYCQPFQKHDFVFNTLISLNGISWINWINCPIAGIDMIGQLKQHIKAHLHCSAKHRKSKLENHKVTALCCGAMVPTMQCNG